jgi:acyl-[acyl carrier protein]--UDP-N-acetylglucosamine O-acyltransferase
VIANDRKPKVDEERKFSGYEWKIGDSVSVGANAVILPDVDIGDFALVGAGAVVTKDVPRHGMVYGNPARLRGFVCKCGARVTLLSKDGEKAIMQCPECKKGLQVPIDLFNQVRE